MSYGDLGNLGAKAGFGHDLGRFVAIPAMKPSQPAHREVIAAVRGAKVKFADETGWYLWGKLCWLWGAATSDVVAFLIYAKRGAVGLLALHGDDIQP